MEHASTFPGGMLADRYRVHELLGEGGMGTVWRATDELLGRVVAIKRIRIAGMADTDIPAARLRMMREARIAATLHHPHIVGVFDVLIVDGEPWLVLEYVPSRTLANILRERGTLPVAEVARIGAQLAGALAAAHAAGVVHRDIKPDNVLLGESRDAVVKLMDFGISHAADAPGITATNVVSGTPAYFAPETARGDDTDGRSDVYSLGATLYEAVEGAPPFGSSGDNVFRLIARIGAGGVPAPRRAGALTSVLMWLTADDPRTRPTAAAAQHTLQSLASGPAASGPAASGPFAFGPFASGPAAMAPPATEIGPVGRDRPPPARSRARLVAVVAVAAVVLIAGGIFAGYRAFSSSSSAAGSSGASQAPTTAAAAAPGAIAVTDPRTADPCSLVEKASVAPFGDPTVLSEYGAFASCSISLGSGPLVFVSFQSPLQAGDAPAGTTEQIGPLTLFRFPLDSGQCDRVVLLSDGNAVSVSALGGTNNTVDLCNLAEAAVQSTVATLRKTGVGARTPLEVNSALAAVRACGLLDATALAAVPGLGSAVGRAGFGDWTCDWGDRKAATTNAVEVQYSRQAPLAADTDGTATDLGGRPGFLKSEGVDCVARVPQRTITSDGSPGVETVEVYVFGPQGDDARCRQAAALATALVPKLPPLS